jgi:hypothetical protein
MLLMTTDADAAKPKEPEVIAQVTAGPAQEIVLAGRRERGRAVPREGSTLRDPVSTALTVRLDRGDADVLALTGWRLARLNDPGDVIVTYTLMVEVPPTGDAVHVLWHEDHQEVPTSLYVGEGTIERHERAGWTVRADVKDVEHGDVVRIEGLIRIR